VPSRRIVTSIAVRTGSCRERVRDCRQGHALADLPLWAQFRLGLQNSATIDRDVDNALALTSSYLRLLADRGVAVNGARILELGPGRDFAPQLALAGLGARVTVADRFLANWDRAYHGELYRRFKARWEGPSEALDAVIAGEGYPPTVITCVAQPAEELVGVADESCDVVLSNAVLEHVYDLPRVWRALARVTRPGGLGIHQIDFRDHWNFDRPLEFLLHEAAGRQLRVSRGRVGRGNRRRLSDHMICLADAGFQIEQVETNMRVAPEYFGAFLPRLRASSSPYRHRDLDDLSALAARIIARRG